eukprot:9706908-Alexandrium_andersonii.AAC.1
MGWREAACTTHFAHHERVPSATRDALGVVRGVGGGTGRPPPAGCRGIQRGVALCSVSYTHLTLPTICSV